MKIKSYNKSYLANISDTIGCLFEYAASNGINPIIFWNKFINSNVAAQIEIGNISYLNKSAIELLQEIGISNNLNLSITKNIYYWAGWALTQFQYESSLSFYRINIDLPIETVLGLYNTLHEADISKFIEIAFSYIQKNSTTNLKKIRTSRGYSQSTLAKLADVQLRSIQMYEQRKNDINKAQAETLFKISKVLGCRIEDLLEY